MKNPFGNDKSTSELEAGFEVSRILAHNGYKLDAPALSVTLGQIAVIIGDTLSRFGLPADRLDDATMVNLVEAIKEALTSKDVLSWDSVVRDITTESSEVVPFLPDTNFDLNECPLDGDAQSALASAGMGTDEDYGLFDSDPFEY
ncbi:MAG: hypothetical protein FP831_09105 [Anaerolineae bacterium]|nr:hypothetical protein [Anaerolineae bacterium]